MSRDGYLDDLRTVTVTAGVALTMEMRLFPEVREQKAAPRTENACVLQIATNPPGAVLFVGDDETPRGKSPLSLDLPPGKYKIRARLNWYREATTTVELQPDDVAAKTLDLAPDFGKLEVVAAQNGVSIALDDRTEGTLDGGFRRSRLAPGTYKLRASLAEHHDYLETVTIRAGETAQVKVPLLRSALGSVRITTDPPGAAIQIDGKERGKAPLLVDRLSGGAHELVARYPRHDDVEIPIEVIDGREQPVSVRLEPRFTTLVVNSTPSASVVIDGNRLGMSPLTVEVDEGDHTVRIEGEADSYRPWEGRVTAIRKVPARVNATLEAIEGSLLLTSTPFGARVQIDGKSQGETPLKVETLLGGAHRYRVGLPGYRPEEGTVRIEGNKRNRVDLTLVELLPEEKARQRVALWEKQTEPERTAAGWRTALSVGAGLVSIGAGYQTWQAWGERATARDTYLGARSDIDGHYATYEQKHWTVVGWGTVSVASAALCGWLGWSAHRIGQTIPPRPVFQVQSGKASVGVQGEW